jgi:hypothetical protein
MSNNVFDDIIRLFLPEISKYLYEPIKFKIFMINNPNKITYRDFSKYELTKYLNYPIESVEDKKILPYKENIYHISLYGSGRLGCKLKFIYIRRTPNFREYMDKFKFINKNFMNSLNNLLNLNPPFLKNIKISDNLNYKIAIKNLYDKHPNFYQKYFQCNTNLPDTFINRNRSCGCYDCFTCDLCILIGKLRNDRWYGDIYMCYNCEKELLERRHERWEDKHERDYDDY